MGLLELGDKVWIKFGLVERFGFGKKIDGDVGHAKKIGFLDNRSGE